MTIWHNLTYVVMDVIRWRRNHHDDEQPLELCWSFKLDHDHLSYIQYPRRENLSMPGFLKGAQVSKPVMISSLECCAVSVIWICLCPDYCTAVTFVHYLLQIWLAQTTYLQTMIILLGSCLSSVKVMSVFHLTIAVIPVQHQWQIWRNAVNCDNSLRLLLIIGNWYFKYFILLSRDILLLLCFLYSINDKNGRKLPVELQIVCKQFCS